MSGYNQGRGDGYDAMWNAMFRTERQAHEDLEAYFERAMPFCPLDDEYYRHGFRDGARVAFETNYANVLRPITIHSYKVRTEGRRP
jgi:hypothetical protein